MPFRNLKDVILRLSEANTWDEAKHEWSLLDVTWAEKPQTCICTHHPILELCELVNKCNGATTTVGNVCVHKFIGLPSNEIFVGFRRIRDDILKSMNVAAIEHAFARKWMTGFERRLYLSFRLKRNIPENEASMKKSINERVLFRMNGGGPYFPWLERDLPPKVPVKPMWKGRAEKPWTGHYEGE